MNGQQTLEDWVVEAVNDTTQPKPCSAISLLHQRATESKPIEEFTYRFGSGNVLTSAELARIFRNKAQSFAAGLPGVQTFWLYAFYGQDQESARHPFTEQGAVDYSGLGTEAPEGRGRAQQEMRQREGFYQHAMTAINDARNATMHAAEIVAGMGRHLMETNLRLSSENSKAQEVILKLAFEQKMQEADNAMSLLKYQRETEEREKFFKLLPALANTVLGGNIFPKETQDTAIIEGIFAELPREQVKFFVGQLPAPLAAMALTRVEELWETKDKKARETQDALAGVRALNVKPELAAKEQT